MLLLPALTAAACAQPTPDLLQLRESYRADLKQSLNDAWRSRPADYEPRTRHRNADGTPIFTNRLFLESSPYLRQHAHNPVDWRPWGDEAFAEAKRRGVPVLLSVGYSTCHWCHVMEEESFEDEEIGAYLNEKYVAIKVDREERPDIDSIYMAAVQALTGRGGWPMTVWLTHERKPFYGGTYFPARDGDRGATTGFLSLLTKMQDIYSTRPEDVTHNASVFVEQIEKSLRPAASGDLPTVELLDQAAALYVDRYDPVHGGIKGHPKFPSGLPTRFLFRRYRTSGDAKFRDIAVNTLRKMAQGGIHDHVGGGFHRYSTDEEWLVPHFEKMLYDNALLVVAYVEAYQATGDEAFAEVARKTLRYVEREMTSPEGVFYSATDADSVGPAGEREEGYFFTWTPAEIAAALSESEMKLLAAHHPVTAAGNFEGRTILTSPGADTLGFAGLDPIYEKLYAVRKKRPMPLLDDKALTAWNGLMISAFATAGFVLDEPAYIATAERAANFLLKNSWADGTLYRSFKDGKARHRAYLEDYACLIQALLDLYEGTGESTWLQQAVELDSELMASFEDLENGGFFRTADDHEELLTREKPAYDGAEPSGNSIAVLNLLRFYQLTTSTSFLKRAEAALKAFAPVLNQAPNALSEMLSAVEFYLSEPKQIVLVTPSSRNQAEPFLNALRTAFVPNHVLAVATEQQASAASGTVALFEGKRAIGGKATAYVCRQQVCKLPTADPEVFRRQLDE